MRLTRPTYAHFDKLGEFFTSLAAVMIGMIIFIAYRFFEVYTLFDRHLTMMDEGARVIASKLIAFVMIFAMLLVSVNLNHFHIRLKKAAIWLGFGITLFINVNFWQTWEGDWLFKWSISLITAAFDFAFAHLFVEKWAERNHKSNLEQAISKLERVKSKAEQLTSEKEAKLSKVEVKLQERIARMKERTCPKCGRDDFNTRQGVNAHISHCEG